MARTVCCEGVTTAGYTLALTSRPGLDLNLASFLQFEHAFVETSMKLDMIIASIIWASTETYSNFASNQAALSTLVKLGPRLISSPTRHEVYLQYQAILQARLVSYYRLPL